MADRISEIRATLRERAKEAIEIGESKSVYCRCPHCRKRATLFAKALLLALEQARILRTHCEATGKICASCKKFEAQLAALVKGES